MEIVVIYKSYTPAQAAAQKRWNSKPENKEKVRQYYKRRFELGDEEYRERIRCQGRERARRAYYAKKAREWGTTLVPSCFSDEEEVQKKP